MCDGGTQIGSILDGSGLHAHLDDGDLIEGAVVLLAVSMQGGGQKLKMCRTPGLGWIEEAGMLAAATHLALDVSGED